jgi:hypothetical protein
MYKSDLHLESPRAIPAGIRQKGQRAALALEKERLQDRRAAAVALAALKSAYRQDLSALLGVSELRQYRALRRSTKSSARAKRIREANKFIDANGIDRRRVVALQKRYMAKVAKVLAHAGPLDPGQVSVPDVLSPIDDPFGLTAYRPPYQGSLWAYWSYRSDSADDPVLRRYLDPTSGRIGSSIRLQLSDADDDDAAGAEYYTSLLTWHATRGAGRLEVSLWLTFVNSTYAGRVSDEFGLSSATYTQWADVYLRVYNPQGADVVESKSMFVFADNVWGDDATWNRQVAAPGDSHKLTFVTTRTYPAGSWLLLDAGIRNVSWFRASDQSVTMSDDLDLRLDAIMVRNRPDVIL